MHDRLLAPSSASKVRVISSGRHCTSTCSDTSSGTLPSSTHQRAKSKSVCEADGKPISISLKPISEQEAEHARLALRPHRVDQRLVAVAQVDGTPDRRLADGLRRPGAVGQVDGGIGSVFGGSFRHAARSGRGRSGCEQSWRSSLVLFAAPPH
jgi:hypothetical protein